MNNEFDKSDRSIHALTGQKKADVFKWPSVGKKGTFAEVPRGMLNIDYSYQRDIIGGNKVLSIASHFAWVFCHPLMVAVRPDMSLYVLDGQHRWVAAFYRDETELIPCMLFDIETVKSEAAIFLALNKNKNPVSAINSQKAGVTAEDDLSLAVQDILEIEQRDPERSGLKRSGFAAVALLRRLVESDADLARKAFSVCCYIAGDKPISGFVLAGLFYCQHKLRGVTDIFHGEHLKRLKAAGIEVLELEARRKKALLGGGDLVLAKAILDFLNKGRRTRLSFPA
jgi:hypothetical protein